MNKMNDYIQKWISLLLSIVILVSSVGIAYGISKNKVDTVQHYVYSIQRDFKKQTIMMYNLAIDIRELQTELKYTTKQIDALNQEIKSLKVLTSIAKKEELCED